MRKPVGPGFLHHHWRYRRRYHIPAVFIPMKMAIKSISPMTASIRAARHMKSFSMPWLRTSIKLHEWDKNHFDITIYPEITRVRRPFQRKRKPSVVRKTVCKGSLFHESYCLDRSCFEVAYEVDDWDAYFPPSLAMIYFKYLAWPLGLS